LSNAETEPFFPSAAMRTASSAASFFAAATFARMSFSSFVMSDMACHPVMRGRDPRIAPRLAFDATLRRQRGFGLFHDRLECSRFADCKIGQNFPVDRHTGFGQPGDEAAVVQAKGPNRRVQTLDPQGTKRALAPLAVTEGILVCLFHRLLGDANRVLAAAVIALGGFQNFLMLGVRGDATFDAGHEILLADTCRLLTRNSRARGRREPVSRSAASTSLRCRHRS